MPHYCERRLLSLLLGIIVALSAGLSAQDFSQVQVGTVKVSENIYMLTGAGGNIGVLAGTDDLLLIDRQFSQLADRIKAALAPLSQGPVRLLLNTNWHYDHVMGNERLAKAGAIIIAQENTRTDMTKEQGFPETGDLIFSSAYPFIDVSHEGSIDGIIVSADKLLGMTDASTKFICGHGPLSDREGVQQFCDMLVAVRDRIARLVKEGKSLDEVVASRPTAEFDESHTAGVPAEMFVKIVYGELAKR